ncbi:flagellin N-terminal helical domain-containing protein [Acidihalobacter prosperus]|uniref:Flagellin n=1 Tax=Acidihalobacter prosperus TaxID=160660 RepID=A0A1A6C5L4_9GAMM|nr:flagellin [Acidihalobacter prosperus]OBS09835.1 Flagellin protein FlaB [Acidihalobacter prosperus]
MALVINTNIASLNAQNNLNSSQSQLDSAIAQLSSGLSINSPADNPAGYAIAQRMTAQINGFDQAMRNANDGISFAQVANGALNTINGALQNIRTLSVQAANSTNSAQDRQALNAEVQQSIAQVNTTAQDTQFNGQSILNGSLSSLVFQVGANAGQIISTNGLDVRGQNLGASYGDGLSINTTTNLSSATGTITINNVAVNLSGNNGSVSDVVAAINNVSSQSQVYAQRADTTAGTVGYTNTGSGTITIDGVTVNVASGATVSDVAAAINAYTTQTNVTATTGTGTLTLTDSTGATITVTGSGGVAIASGGNISAGIELYTKVGGAIAVSGSATTLSNIGLSGTGVNFSSLSTLTLNSTNVLTYDNAKTAIKAMDFALNQLSRDGGLLGALQSRFQATISNLQSASTNTQAARSRIQDTNFAAQTAALSRAQILQQAGVAMVAQANTDPQVALTLLK